MTNFIYNMQDELFHLNMILPVGEFSPIVKLVDHIEAQGKQLRELNAAITKRNATIEKYEREKKKLQKHNALLLEKVDELNEGIRDSEDLTWKQKYDALLQSSEQAISALQKKCQEYKNADTIADSVKAVRCPWGSNAEIISDKTARIKELEEKNKKLERRRNELITRANELSAENKRLEAEKKIADDRWWESEKELTKEKLANKKLKRDNDILQGKVNEISDLAESIVMLCDDEE